jgi:TolB-like protein/DNA-binding winged helix-turn-helix (wHTH) protein
MMGNPEEADSIVRFQGFELNLQSGELRRDGTRIKLQDQPFKVLVALLQRPGQVVTREELRQLIWPHESIGDFDHAINLAIGKLRSSLGDSADVPHLIETLPRRGYRFIGTMGPDAIKVAKKSSSARRWRLVLIAAPLLVVVAILFLLDVGGLRSKLFSRSASQVPIRSLAVLPLTSLSSDQEQDYFTEGMTEALITELGNISALRVISHQSVMQYKGSKKTVPQIAHDLDVDAVVEGSIMRAGDQVRIAVQLIDGRTDRHLWAESYQREMRAILSLQNDVAKAIANEVKVKLTSQEEKLLASAALVNPEAHEAYLKGLYYVNRWPEPESVHCIESFKRATEMEPTFASAHAGLATCYAVMPWTFPPKEVFPQAKAAAKEAIRLDANQAEAYAALGAVNMFYEWDWESAERNLRRAVELNPNRSFSRASYAIYFAFLGRSEEAIREAKESVLLDPASILMSRNLAFVYQLAHKYPEYAAQAQTTLELAPSDGTAKWDLAWALALQGKRNEAAEQLKVGIWPLTRAIVLATMGENEQARRALKEAGKATCCKFDYAMVYALLGERDTAIGMLEKAFDERAAEMVQLYTNPAFDSLRSDPRVQALLHRMNFPK